MHALSRLLWLIENCLTSCPLLYRNLWRTAKIWIFAPGIYVRVMYLWYRRPGIDSGICDRGGVLYWLGVWGPSRSPAGPGQHSVWGLTAKNERRKKTYFLPSPFFIYLSLSFIGGGGAPVHPRLNPHLPYPSPIFTKFNISGRRSKHQSVK